MKKLIFFLLFFVSLAAKAQFVQSEQIMIYQHQTDLTGLTANNGQLAYCLDTKQYFKFDGSSWIVSDKTTVKKSIISVNGLATGATTVYTLEPSTLNFYPVMVVFRVISVSGVTVKPTISVGSNSTAYDNIVTSSLLSTILSTVGTNGGAPTLAATSIPLAGGTVIKANVSVAGLATAYTVAVEIIGFYDN